MASNKKRKLDTGHPPQMMSAVALRRKLMGEKATDKHDSQLDASEEFAPNLQLDEPASTKKSRKQNAPGKGKGEAVSQPVATEPDEGVESHSTEGPEAQLNPDKSKRTQLSSFKPNKKNCQRRSDGSVLLKLPDGERLVVLGSYGIKVESGEATIAGATLYPSETVHWVHAPHCHALAVLRCSDESTIKLLPHPQAENLRRLERLSPVFGNLWNDHEDDVTGGVNRTFQLLATTDDGPKRAMLQDLKSPAEWNKKIVSLVSSKHTRPPIILVCGPKSSGKSTFSKILTNRFITDCGGTKKRTWAGAAVLDIDPGQPEFSAPGIISLARLDEPNLSPPFGHPSLPDKQVPRSHALTAVSPAFNVGQYRECALDLFSHYQTTLRAKYPLVINTPGWVQGTGLELLSALIRNIRPAEVIYMSEDGPEDTVEGLKAACGNITLSTLPSQSGDYTSRTALHLRTMQTMSYFHMEGIPDEMVHWNPSPLTSIPPLEVKYAGPSQGIAGILCYGSQLLPELLADAINGTIVAVVEIQDQKAFQTMLKSNDHSSEAVPDVDMALDANEETGEIPIRGLEPTLVTRTPERIPFIQQEVSLDPKCSRSLGLALIRGIDTKREVLQLLTPLAPEKMEALTNGNSMIVLLAGEFDPPTWAYVEDRYSQGYTKGGSEQEANEDSIEVIDEDTDDDMSDDAAEGLEPLADQSEIPWTETLHGSQKRAVGSRVWRVRRDLGRGGTAAG